MPSATAQDEPPVAHDESHQGHDSHDAIGRVYAKLLSHDGGIVRIYVPGFGVVDGSGGADDLMKPSAPPLVVGC
jgi:hypothetical protein